jgi:tRNA nucleotidyltransferase/poly(A) polymerase
MFKFYEVGGKVRDEILGLESKDVDYVAVPNDGLLEKNHDAYEMFVILETYLHNQNFEIFLTTPECFTIRAKFPKDHKYQGVADFVMARKEVGYIQGTRTPIIKPGTLYDDLERRDFTLNALARDEDGQIIDYFNGLNDLNEKKLVTPLEAKTTMLDDPLRLLRAFRFSITKGFEISPDIMNTCTSNEVIDKLETVVSQERIREEIFKMTKHDTLGTLELFERIRVLNPRILKIIFSNGMWLKPTNEK